MKPCNFLFGPKPHLKRPFFRIKRVMNRGKKAANLAKKILFRIEREERRRLAWHLGGFGVSFAASLAFTWLGYRELMNEAGHSGLFSFLSLLFSDFSAVMVNLSDFLLSLLESFPAFAAALLLLGLFFAIWSAARLMDGIALIRAHRFH